jgi:Ca2+-dependent lipid-binding protein
LYIGKLKRNLQDKKNTKIKLILDLQKQLKEELKKKEKNLEAIQKNYELVQETQNKKKEIELKSMEDFLVKRDKLAQELKILNEEVLELQLFKDQRVGTGTG